MRCKTCSRDLPADEFYSSNKSRCKECIRAAATEHRYANIERVREYDKFRASQPHRMALRKKITKTYGLQFPQRRKATNAINNAIRDGRLEKYPCELCGNQKSVGHHCDYARPLDVVWLCQAHHKQTHADFDKYKEAA